MHVGSTPWQFHYLPMICPHTPLTLTGNSRPGSKPRAAFTLVELLVVIAIIGTLVLLLLPAIQAARESARQNSCRHALRQLALASLEYESAHAHFPAAAADTVSWSQHVRLLPFLDQQALWDRISRPPVGQQNQDSDVLDDLPTLEILLCPTDPQAEILDQPARTNYRGNAGADVGRWDPAAMHEINDGIFVGGEEIRAEQITDGLSNTALFSEMALGDDDDAVLQLLSDWRLAPSGRAADQFFLSCSMALAGNGRGRIDHFSLAGRSWALGTLNNSRYNHVMPPNTGSCLSNSVRRATPTTVDQVVMDMGAATSATSWHPGGVFVAFADGHAEFVSEEIEVAVWREIGTRSPADAVNLGRPRN